MMCCLLELDTGTETERQLRAKLDAYEMMHSAAAREYLYGLYSRFGAERPEPVFRLLFAVRRLSGSRSIGTRPSHPANCKH